MKPQRFNDGIVKIYTVENTAERGEMPKEGLAIKASLRFKQRMIGIQRLILADKNNSKIDNLVRTPYLSSIDPLDIAIIGGNQYQITFLQQIEDVEPPVMDLTLERLVGNEYDV